MDKEKWKSIMLPRSIVEALEVFANSGISKGLGFTNKSQLASYAIREFLYHYADSISEYQFIDAEDGKITILDNSISKTAEIKIAKHGKLKNVTELQCSIDNENYCEHIKFILICPTALKHLKKYGYASDNPAII